jgi:hypothetical protein
MAPLQHRIFVSHSHLDNVFILVLSPNAMNSKWVRVSGEIGCDTMRRV